MFSNDGSVVNWVDESFAPTTGSGEFLPTTDLAARAWHPAGTHKTGRMFFSDLATGAFLSEFQVVDLRPEPGAYCSAHMGMPIMGGHKDLLVNAWYMGGADLIDFTNPRAPQGGRVLRHGAVRAKGLGYQGPTFKTGPGVPVCASDGVHNPNSARGSWCSGPGSEGRTPHGGPPEPADRGHVALAGRPRGSPDPPGQPGGSVRRLEGAAGYGALFAWTRAPIAQHTRSVATLVTVAHQHLRSSHNWMAPFMAGGRTPLTATCQAVTSGTSAGLPPLAWQVPASSESPGSRA